MASSFHLMLSSKVNDDDNTTFNNHAGDFKVQLAKVLDARSEAWEVALVDMTYTAQEFANLYATDVTVETRANKPVFENNYIITYDQTFDLWVCIIEEKRYYKGGALDTLVHPLTFEQYHYSWHTFKFTFIQKLFEKAGDYLNVQFINNEIIISGKATLYEQLRFTCSANFRRLFKIPEKIPKSTRNDYATILKIPYTIPDILADTSPIIHTPFSKETKLTLSLNNNYQNTYSSAYADDLKTIIDIDTDQFWTVDMFSRTFKAIIEHLPDHLKVYIKSITIDKYALKIIATGPPYYEKIPFVFSDGFTEVFGLSNEYGPWHEFNSAFNNILSEESSEDDVAINGVPMKFNVWKPKEGAEEKTYPCTEKIRPAFYNDMKSLINEINYKIDAAIYFIDWKRKSNTKPHTFFQLDNDNKVQYMERANYKILLGSTLLTRFHLPRSWLTESVTGKYSANLKPPKRDYLYVHCDCLAYHYINKQSSDLIRCVANSHDIGGRVVQTFDNPQYYGVASRHIANINMYITDGLYNDILRFKDDVIFTLHFRKC